MTVPTAPDLSMLPPLALQIGGEQITDAAGGTFEHVYAGTGEVTGEVPLAGAGDVDAAVRAARAALPGWRSAPATVRRDALLAMGRLVHDNAAELSTLNVIDNGTPIMVAAFQNTLASDLFTYNAGWADKGGGEVHQTWPVRALDYSRDEPYGVVGVIIPWNGPVTAVAQVLGPALAAGNTVVLKPPELAPYSVLAMGRLFAEAGFPPGVVNIVPGGPEAGDALVRHPDVDKVHFTGSGATARAITHAAADTLKPLGFELGGKSAVVVFDDADLSQATTGALQGISFNLAGQGCINGTRVLAQRGIYDQLVESVAAAAAEIAQGDPFDFETVMGPVANEAALTRILGVIDDTKNTSARLISGGSRLGGDYAGGFYIQPTVFADVDNSSALAQHEVFGPVQAIIPFDTEADAVRLANDTTYGLAGYVYTENLGRTHRMAESLEAGNLWVNGGVGIPASAPFGGVKQSGYGRIGGEAGIREFTRPKNVWIAL